MNYWRLFVVGAVMGGLAMPNSATAGGWKRQHAALCNSAAGGGEIYDDGNGINLGTSGSGGTMICPYDDDSAIPRTSLTTLNVHGRWGGSTTAPSVAACVKYYAGFGGQGLGYDCPAATSASNVGSFTIQPSLSVWSGNGAEFGYLKIVVPTNGWIYGWYTAF